jgi:hypothetical protein
MTKEELEQTLTQLQAQEYQAVHQLGEIRGAINLLRSLIAKENDPNPQPKEPE